MSERAYLLSFWRIGADAEYGEEPDARSIHRRREGAAARALGLAMSAPPEEAPTDHESNRFLEILTGRSIEEDYPDKEETGRRFKAELSRWLESPPDNDPFDIGTYETGPMILVVPIDIED